MRRIIAVVALLALVTTLLFPVAGFMAPHRPRVLAVSAIDASAAARFTSDTNSARAAHGLRALTVASDLSSNAVNHSEQMAAHGSIWDDSNVGSEVCCWRSLGENTGEGPDEPSIQQALMNSAPHRANILGTSFTQIGVVDAGGTMYVTEVFRQPAVTAAPSPAPKPEPASRPSPTTTRDASSITPTPSCVR